LLVQAAMLCSGPALFAVGEADPTYDAGALEQIRTATGAVTVVLPDANHSLEVPGDADRSLQHLRTVMQAIQKNLE
jgi:hypothetical protein